MTSFGTGTAITAQSLNTAFANLQAQISSSGGAPLGSVLMWAGTTANIPSGYALCNGASLPTSGTYEPLWNVIQYRYGGSGANFSLPDFTSRVPEGITGVPTVPATDTTSASSAVDVHTHGVNSSFTAGNTNTSLTAGSVNSSFTAGNANNHTHGVAANTGNASSNHTHVYFKPNSGANNNTGGAGADHSHGFSTTSAGSNSTISINSSFSAGNTNTSLTAGSVNSSFTAGNATTINASTLSHTHTVSITQVVFIIKVV